MRRRPHVLVGTVLSAAAALAAADETITNEVARNNQGERRISRRRRRRRTREGLLREEEEGRDAMIPRKRVPADLFHRPPPPGTSSSSRPAQLSDVIRSIGEQDGQHHHHHNPVPTQFIVNGIPVRANRYPWFGAVFDKDVRWGGCAGSLIAPDWILTAAHCFPEGSGTKTDRHGDEDAFYELGFLGFECMKSDWNCGQVYDDVRIERVEVHPNFQFQSGNRLYLPPDLALVKLERAVVGIEPVAIDTGEWASIVDDNSNLIGRTFTTMGTGFTVGKDVNSIPDYLQQVEVPYVDTDTCARTYGFSPTEPAWTSAICAGEPEYDSCNGDSGGPLILRRGTVTTANGLPLAEDVLVGAVSFGNPSCLGYPPGVYASVGKEIDWIRETVCDGTNDPYYCAGYRDNNNNNNRNTNGGSEEYGAEKCGREATKAFKYKRVRRTCGWLANKSRRSISKLCKRKRLFRKLCPETCKKKC